MQGSLHTSRPVLPQAINHALKELTPEGTNITLREIFKTSYYTSDNMQYTKQTILSKAPAGCKALLVWYEINTAAGNRFYHYSLWKEKHGTWYDCEPILFAATGKVRIITDEDWANFQACIYCFLQLDAYLAQETLIQPPASESLIGALPENKDLPWADLEQLPLYPQRARRMAEIHRQALQAAARPANPEPIMNQNPLYDSMEIDDSDDNDILEVQEIPRHMPSQMEIDQEAKIWIRPDTVGLYCEAQRACNCAIHAYNALAKKRLLIADQVCNYLQRRSIPQKELPEDDARYQIGGPY